MYATTWCLGAPYKGTSGDGFFKDRVVLFGVGWPERNRLGLIGLCRSELFG